MHITAAKHFIIELTNVKKFLYYKETKTLVPKIKKILKLLDNTYLEHLIHKFDNNSYSATFLISESHLSIHTWPEYSYVGLDFYSCNKSIDVNKTIYLIKELFDCQINSMVVYRGRPRLNCKYIRG